LTEEKLESARSLCVRSLVGIGTIFPRGSVKVHCLALVGRDLATSRQERDDLPPRCAAVERWRRRGER